MAHLCGERGVSEAATAAGQTTYHGETYYFCGLGCLRRFEAAPETFVKPPPTAASPAPEAIDPRTYVCPMDPEVRSPKPGACPKCGGLGTEMKFEPALTVPDQSLSLRKGAVVPWALAFAWFAAHHATEAFIEGILVYHRYNAAFIAPVPNYDCGAPARPAARIPCFSAATVVVPSCRMPATRAASAAPSRKAPRGSPVDPSHFARVPGSARQCRNARPRPLPDVCSLHSVRAREHGG
jgi:YHS domain-containing protein